VLKNTLILHKSAGKSKLFLVNPKEAYGHPNPANAEFEFCQLSGLHKHIHNPFDIYSPTKVLLPGFWCPYACLLVQKTHQPG
jgi:hypothetical protein